MKTESTSIFSILFKTSRLYSISNRTT